MKRYTLGVGLALIAVIVGPLEVVPYLYRVSAGAPAPASAHATVLFGGDMLFDRTVRSTIDEKGGDYVFACLDPLLESADLVVANLEGPITATSSRSLGSEVGAPDNYVFTFPLSTAVLLQKHHITLVNLGNNHITNFGVEGVRSTIVALTDAGVGYIGDPLQQTVAERDLHGVHLAFVNYNEFSPSSTASTTIAQIQNERSKGNIVVVYTHWGIEYATTSPAYVQQLAHRFADAGATLVVGSHPHVVEEHERYHDTDIYYSLGNLIFDQYWNDDVSHGLVLKVVFTANGISALQEIPVALERSRQTCPVR